jgi:hypothetical protein
MFTKDLSANVPLYGQEQCSWCGAASGQMARNGYPNPGDRLFYAQVDVWNTIQVHNSTAAADTASGWATDAHGLTGCLQSLNNPPGVHWVEFSDANRNVVLFDVLFWMNQREYPSPVLVNQGGHWAVIVRYETDVEPLAGSSPTLQSIKYHDPEPHNVGTVTTQTGAQWFSGPWNGSIIYSGTWLGKYVAVVEPPFEAGRVRGRRVTRTGRKLLSSVRAVEHARKWIAELKLAEDSEYALLSRRDVDALDPLLVRDEPLGGRARNVPHYYIVPFGFKKELGDRGSRLARVSVLVNAYTGNFEEVTAFGSPVHYLSEEEALDVVGSAFQLKRGQLRNAQTTLMFQPSDIGHIRAYPFWRVEVGRRTVYVDQLGTLYGKLLPSVPGD